VTGYIVVVRLPEKTLTAGDLADCHSHLHGIVQLFLKFVEGTGAAQNTVQIGWPRRISGQYLAGALACHVEHWNFNFSIAYARLQS
jgi:hypothetical protein